MPDKRWEFTLHHNVCHLANQKTGFFVYHWLRTLKTSFPTFLSRIGRHFKHSVNMSIDVKMVILTGNQVRCGFQCLLCHPEVSASLCERLLSILDTYTQTQAQADQGIGVDVEGLRFLCGVGE